MDLKKLPRPLLILGWAAIIAIPASCFIFGWRDIKLTCRRPSPGAPPTCQVSEAFAMGLYTRPVTVAQATGVSFQIRPSDRGAAGPGGGGSTTPGTVILATPSGEVPVSRGHVEGDAKLELIRKMQEFLDTPDSLVFTHHARMHSLFGYLGVVGMGGLVLLLLAVLWAQLRRRLGWVKVPEKD